MAKKSAANKVKRNRISMARAGRLFRLVKVLAVGAVPRAQLLKKLRVGMRTFYRDVDLLRECGIEVDTKDSSYALVGKLDDALHRLPYPDPELTFGEVTSLMKGVSGSAKKLRQQFEQMTR